MTAQRFIIVDDHPLFRKALNQALSASFDQVQIEEAGSLDELTTSLSRDLDTDLILLDLSVPGVQGLSGLLYLRSQHPEIPVIVMSGYDKPATIRRCIKVGASGFIPKTQPVEQFGAAVRQVLDGGIWTPPNLDLPPEHDKQTGEVVDRISTLTPQQIRVLMMLGEGLLNKQIAFKLDVSEATVKAHVSAILQKLHVDSRTQAVITVNKIDSGDWEAPAN